MWNGRNLKDNNGWGLQMCSLQRPESQVFFSNIPSDEKALEKWMKLLNQTGGPNFVKNILDIVIYT